METLVTALQLCSRDVLSAAAHPRQTPLPTTHGKLPKVCRGWSSYSTYRGQPYQPHFVVYSQHKEGQLAGKCPASISSEVEAEVYVACKPISGGQELQGDFSPFEPQLCGCVRDRA